MAQVDFTNTLNGLIPVAPSYDAVTGRAWIPIADLPDDFKSADQHKVGRIDLIGFGSFVTSRTDVSQQPYRVQIIGAPPGITAAANSWYTLWDDDAGSSGGFIMVGFDAPPVTLPKVPDTGLMAEVFQNAYVDVPPPDMQYYDANTLFDRNIRDNLEAVRKGNENRDLTSGAAFWAVHITTAFQGYVVKDNDPDTEQATMQGIQYGITGAHSSDTRRAGSLIFLETIRDDKRADVGAMATLERYTAAHEVGHQFKLEHTDGRFPDPNDMDPSDDYIMTDKLDQTGMAPNVAFSAVSLKKIRSIAFPPQGD
ncbi:MAG: hypothetical protein D6690_10045 [Nitrospirae bacterium]|nr:MAG: hypothetical protein D6690_10045 [Nitrospirota bacterium]